MRRRALLQWATAILASPQLVLAQVHRITDAEELRNGVHGHS
jgi:hypothetical protein